jgi:hypothetical protein
MIMKRASVVLAVVGLFTLAAGVQAQTLAPQQTFRFRANSYGCLSKDKFDAAYQHARAGEQGKMQEYFSGYECLSTPASSDFRVLRVVGHDVEFVNAQNRDQQGLWTADKFIQQ